jgi:opacity protein-like surface antigen
MRKAIAGGLLVACLAAGATEASAADVETDYAPPEMSGWYLAVSGGLNRIFDLDYETDGTEPVPFSDDGEIDFD